jgi:Skp family chaperone for outer membrane proteins
MKIFRAIAAVAFVAVFCCGSALAQRNTGGAPAARPTATPASTAPTTLGPIPDSKVALIDSSAFADEKQGITKFVNALKKVNVEFQPRQTELQGLQAQIEKATKDLQAAAPVQDPKISAQQQEKIDQMKKDYQRKGEDAQAAFNKRLEEVLSPVYEEIGKALDAFAKARGITLILDVTKVQGIVSAVDSMDITRAFIADYNSKNPATASLTPK